MNNYDRILSLLVRLFHSFLINLYLVALSLVQRAFGSLEEWIPASVDITQFFTQWFARNREHRSSEFAASMAALERIPSGGEAPGDRAALAKDAAASLGKGDASKTVLIKCPPERHIAVEFHELGKELVSVWGVQMLL